MEFTWEQEEQATEYVIQNLITPGIVKPWFETREACEDWMGDIFFEAARYYMEALLNERVYYVNEKDGEEYYVDD